MQPTIRRPAALSIALAATLALFVGAHGDASANGPLPRRTIVKTSKIAPGLVLKRIVDEKLPRHTYVLIVDLTKPLTLDVALGASSLPDITPEVVRRVNQRTPSITIELPQ